MFRKLGTRALPAAVAATLAAALMTAPVAAVAPTNDDVDDATVIAALPYTNSQDTTEATADPDDPECVGDDHSVWYSFTPADDLEVLADTFGSDYDTTLSVYTGPVGALVQVACNDDSFSLQSRVLFNAEAGVRYLFMIGSFDSAPGGALVLNVDEAPPPLQIEVHIRKVGQIDDSGVATIRGRVTCSREAPVSILGTVRQRRAGTDAVSTFAKIVECEGNTRWRAKAIGETARFKPGRVRVIAAATVFDMERGEVVRDRAARWVALE